MKTVRRLGTYDQKFVTLIAKGTIAVDDVVGLDVSQTTTARFESAVKSVGIATVGDPWACGVAQEAAVSGQAFKVQVYGPRTGVPASTVAAKDPLVSITAGKVDKQVAACTAPVFGIALGADSGGLADIFLLDPLKLSTS